MEKVIKLKTGLKLLYASDEIISSEIMDKNMAMERLDSSSDLEAGIYEGGLKVWECAVDLCNFLDDHPNGTTGLDVLELGCGAGLPSIVALKKGAKSVTLQDFNDFVIEAFTKKNFALNDMMGAEGETTLFVSGEWGNSLVGAIGPRRFQLILTSETIYNESNYGLLLDTMDLLLDNGGKILLAAKTYYFGVGGSIPSFGEHVKEHGIFRMEEVWSTKTSPVPRKILELKRRT